MIYCGNQYGKEGLGIAVLNLSELNLTQSDPEIDKTQNKSF